MELFSLFRCEINSNYFKIVKTGHFDRKIAKIRPKIMEIKLSFAPIGLFGAKCFCPNCTTGVV